MSGVGLLVIGSWLAMSLAKMMRLQGLVSKAVMTLSISKMSTSQLMQLGPQQKSPLLMTK